MADEDDFDDIQNFKEEDKLSGYETSPLWKQDPRANLFRPHKGTYLVVLPSIILLALLTALVFTFSGYPYLNELQQNISDHGVPSNGPSFQQHFTEKDVSKTTFGQIEEDQILPKIDICYVCNCSAPVPYYSPPANATAAFRRLRVGDIWGKTGVDANNFLQKTIFDMYCAEAHLTSNQAKKLIHAAVKSPHDAMAWSLQNLTTAKPTMYLHTATSPHSKANPFRPQYIQRHGRAIRTWLDLQSLKNDTWQVVWIVIEDDTTIDPLIAKMLSVSGVPFVYFAYGQTNSWGNAQKNAGMQMAYALSRPIPRGLFGHGPVYGLDDDNQVLPEFFDMAITLDRFGVVPVAFSNKRGRIMHQEEPIVNAEGVLTGVRGKWASRKYAFDYGALVYNSSMLGSIVKGPDFWGWYKFGGESEFVDKLVSNYASIEPLCKKNESLPDGGCSVVIHNKILSPEDRIIKDPFVASMQTSLGVK